MTLTATELDTQQIHIAEEQLPETETQDLAQRPEKGTNRLNGPQTPEATQRPKPQSLQSKTPKP